MLAEITEHNRKKLDELISTLDFYKRKLESMDYIHQQQEFFSLMKEFSKFVASVSDYELCNLFYHSRVYDEYEAFFREQNNYYLRAIEAVEAVAVMTKQLNDYTSISEMIDYDRIKDRYEGKKEIIKLLDLDSVRNLVMVGSGPMPETVLYFCENTNIENIIALDNNQEAIYMAGRMINKLGLNRIRLMHVNGVDYDYKDADAVYIASFVSVKDKILDRIAETGKENVQVVVGRADHLQKMLYNDFSNNLHRLLSITDKVPSKNSLSRKWSIKIEKYKI